MTVVNLKVPCTVFLVTGETGEYSDHSEWTVAAYITRKEAQKHVDLCEKWYNDEDALSKRYNTPRLNCPYDPDFMCDYTGTTWRIHEIPLRQRIPKLTLAK